jgi:hypothetical protein
MTSWEGREGMVYETILTQDWVVITVQPLLTAQLDTHLRPQKKKRGSH